MSDTSNTDLDGLDFDDRTTKDIFNERLQQARENSVDDGLEDRIVSNFQPWIESKSINQ
jgi:hypothetical protein